MLPNLIVIGAGKSGSTSLHEYLDMHPEIAMSKTKELNFFSTDFDAAGLRWYESQFRGGTAVRGESSPRYTQHPTFTGTPARMARVAPDARLVYIVRDPVDRMLSSYRFNRHAIQYQRREIEEVMARMETEQAVLSSCYALQLERYLEHLPQEQILVVDLRDLGADPAGTMARVFRHAGVDETFTTPAFEHRFNTTEGGARPNRGGRWVIGASKRLVGERRTAWLRNRTSHAAVPFLLHRPQVPEVVLDPDARARLEEFLRPDAARFRELTGLAFEHWSV